MDKFIVSGLIFTLGFLLGGTVQKQQIVSVQFKELTRKVDHLNFNVDRYVIGGHPNLPIVMPKSIAEMMRDVYNRGEYDAK